MDDAQIAKDEYWSETYAATIVAGIALALFLIFIELAELFFPMVWLNTEEVLVPDHFVGQDPIVTAYRVIRKDVSLSFLVTVRSTDHDHFICSGGWQGPFNYRAAASATNPLRMHLSKWMGASSMDAIGCTVKNGFGDGSFYIDTCHQRKLIGLFPVERCVTSNIFRRKGNET